MQFNVHRCTLEVPNDDVLAVASCKDNLYQVIFTKVRGADMANIVQLLKKNRAMKLWHRRLSQLNVRSMHFIENMLSGMTLTRMNHPFHFVKNVYKAYNKEHYF